MPPGTGNIFNMGLGPPVCTDCNVLGFHRNRNDYSPVWICPRCMSGKLNSSLWEYSNSIQRQIEENSLMFEGKTNVEISGIKVAHALFRSFIKGYDDEPNVRYRPWLEEHVGKQGVDWEWDLCPEDHDLIEISFANKEHATLFEISCP